MSASWLSASWFVRELTRNPQTEDSGIRDFRDLDWQTNEEKLSFILTEFENNVLVDLSRVYLYLLQLVLMNVVDYRC